MKLHDLKPHPGSRKSKIRRGRGNASGRGTFSGRGVKGQNARTGGGVRIGFEGGQTPLLQRMPKRRGFKNPNRKTYAPINLSTLEKCFENNAVVSLEALKEKKLIRNNTVGAKILANGEVSKKLTIKDIPVSATAKAKVEKAGGKVEGTASEREEPKAGSREPKKVENVAGIEKQE